MREQEQQTHFKIVRKNGQALYPGGKSIVYESGTTVSLSGDEFDPSNQCGRGLHYGTIESCVLNGMGLLSRDSDSQAALAAVPWSVEIKVLEVNPTGQEIRLGWGKFKTDKLAVVREIPANEYLPLMVASKVESVRQVGAVLISQQPEDSRIQLQALLDPKDMVTNWLPRWDYLLPPIDRFVGIKVKSTRELERSRRNFTLSRLPTQIRGSISRIFPDIVCAKVEGVAGKGSDGIGLRWLQPLS